ncbi:MAG: metallophosphoesterase [Panacagrimonas sp.]
MKLQVMSDLHLTVAPFEAPQTDADLIVLAGDIARPDQAIAFARSLGKPVVYVAGNHEFYGGSLTGTYARLKSLAKGSDVHLLEREVAVIGGTRFLGTTLWSDFGGFERESEREAAIAIAVRLVRDFSRIRLDDERPDLLTPLGGADEFRRSAAWLDVMLAQPFDGPTVVVTHHAPSLRSINPRFADSPLNPCFVSDAEHLIVGGRAQLWIHGHMHDRSDYVVEGGTRVLCNPRGYSRGEINENAAFDPACVVTVA